MKLHNGQSVVLNGAFVERVTGDTFTFSDRVGTVVAAGDLLANIEVDGRVVIGNQFADHRISGAWDVGAQLFHGDGRKVTFIGHDKDGFALFIEGWVPVNSTLPTNLKIGN